MTARKFYRIIYKRVIAAALLAVLIAFSGIFQGNAERLTLAATPSFTVSVDYTQVKGDGGRYVPWDTYYFMDGTLSFDWLMDTDNFSVIFPISAGTAARLDIARDGYTGLTEVYYRIFGSIAKAELGNDSDVISGGYTINTGVIKNGTTYSAASVVATSHPGNVLPTDAAETQFTYPHFVLDSSNRGFSFEYNAGGTNTITSHLQILDNKIMFSTDGLRTGNIYPLIFHSLSAPGFGQNLSGISPEFIYYAFTGINTSSFKSEPYAQDYEYAAVNIAANQYVYDTSNISWHDVNHTLLRPDTNTAGNKLSMDPATENRVKVSFELPKAWDDTIAGFTEPINYGTLPDPYMPTFCINYTFEGSTVRLLFDGNSSELDLAGSGSTGFTDQTPEKPLVFVSDMQDDINVKPSKVNVKENRVELILTDLEFSSVFNNSKITITKNEHYEIAVCGDQFVNPLTIYSFLEYTPIFENEMFYANVTPYPNIEGTYIIWVSEGYEMTPKYFSKANKNNVSIPYDGRSASVQLMIPNADLANPRYAWYIIEFVPKDYHGEPIYSQPFFYKPSMDSVVVGRPRNFKINYQEMMPKDHTLQDAELTLGMSWEIASLETLEHLLNNSPDKKLTVTYSLNNGLVPDGMPSFGSLTITLELVDDVIVLTDSNASFNLAEGSPSISLPDMPGGGVVLNVTAILDTVHRTLENKTADFKYPNIYFVNVSNSGQYSMNEVLVLDDFTALTLTPPQSFVIREGERFYADENDTAGKIMLETSFAAPYGRIKEFVDQQWLLYGEGLENTNPVVSFTLLISQDEQKLLKLSSDLANVNRNNPGTGLPEADATFFESGRGDENAFELEGDMVQTLRGGWILGIVDYPFNPYEPKYNDFSNPALGAEKDRFLYVPDIGLEYFPNINDMYNIIGLDKNQKYYAAMYAIVTYFNGTDKPAAEFYSDLTGIIAITTSGDVMPVDPTEKPPLAPNPDLSSIEHTDTWASFLWNNVKQPDEEKIYYEVIRTTKPIDPEVLNYRIPYTDFFAQYTPADDLDKTGYRFRETESGSVSEKYNIGSKIWSATSDVSLTPEADNRFKFINNLLIPNTVYYYYVRSVKLIGGLEANYSVWNGLSITTSMVRPPVDLKALLSGVDFDTKTEAVLEFDVPIQAINQIGSDFTLWLSMKEGSGGWSEPVRMVTFFDTPIPSVTNEGYFRFRFKVTGLKSDTGYQFRVRMHDTTGNFSIWSNTAEYRTGFDQGEYDNQHDLTSWLDFLKRNLKDEFKDWYWPLAESSSQASLLYRYSMIDTLISNTPGSQIIAYDKEVERLTVLLPAYVIQQAAASGKSFSFINGDLETVIPPGALTDAMDGVVSALADKKANNANDHYVRIMLSYMPVYSTPDQQETAERQCAVQVDAVSVKKTAKSVDSEITKVLFEKMDDDLFYADARARILQMLEQNKTYEEIALYVYSCIAQQKNYLMSEVNRLLTESFYGQYTISSFSSPFIHALIAADPRDTISGYTQKSGGFERTAATPYKDGLAIRVPSPSLLLFTKFNTAQKIEGFSESVELPGDMAALVSKYGLTAYFSEGQSPLQSPLNAGQAMGVTAKIAGASSSDPAAWLKQKGYVLTGKTTASTITQQEAAYLLMALYEIKSGLSVNSMQIRNFGATSGIQGIDAKYLKSVQAAFELGILYDESMDSKGSVTMLDLLNMLGRLNSKLPL